MARRSSSPSITAGFPILESFGVWGCFFLVLVQEFNLSYHIKDLLVFCGGPSTDHGQNVQQHIRPLIRLLLSNFVMGFFPRESSSWPALGLLSGKTAFQSITGQRQRIKL